MRCSKCNYPVPYGSAFCPECGTAVHIAPAASQRAAQAGTMKKSKAGNIANLLSPVGFALAYLMMMSFASATGGDTVVQYTVGAVLFLFAACIVDFILGLVILFKKTPSPKLSYVYLALAVAAVLVYALPNFGYVIATHGWGFLILIPALVQVMAGFLYLKDLHTNGKGSAFIAGVIVPAVIIVAVIAWTLLFSFGVGKPFYVGEYEVVDASSRWFFDSPHPAYGTEIDLNGPEVVDSDKVSLTVKNDTCYFYYYGETYVGTFKKTKQDFRGLKLSFDKEPPTVNDFYLCDYKGNKSLDDCEISIYESDGKITAEIELISANKTITSSTVFYRGKYEFVKIK